MPIGTGSINRASRTSKKTVKPQENKTETVVKEEIPAAVEVKSVTKKAPAKKSAAKKQEPKVEKETAFVVGNECCHLTEDLPIHLL